MKSGFVNEIKTEVKAKDLELINKQTRRKLKEDEVYAFNIILCDNDVDREYECFNLDTLQELAKLYVGKTGIFDHSMKGRDQCARIYYAEVVKGDKSTKTGMDLYQLKAKAYMPKTTKNADLILEIDSGIKREVSVGCSVEHAYCSICGIDRKKRSCKHVKGNVYTKNGEKTVCHIVLDTARDAFEWSFVAVPAQIGAGVVKSLKKVDERVEKMDIKSVKKSLNVDGEEIVIAKSAAAFILNHIADLERLAEVGTLHIEQMKKDIVKSCAITRPALKKPMLEAILDKMDVEEIKALKESFDADLDEFFPARAQINNAKIENKKRKDSGFVI